VVNDQLLVCIHPCLDDERSSDSNIDIVFRFKMSAPEMFFNACKQLNLQVCTVILVTDGRTNWRGMIEPKSILAEERCA
jgi:hypothetical protein